jgi:hypothetical protein
MKTRINRLIRSHEKARKTRLIDKIKYEIEFEASVKAKQLR